MAGRRRFSIGGKTTDTAAIAIVALLAFVAASWWWPWRPGRIGGLVFGTLAALLFVAAVMYGARRSLRARPFGTARRWLDVHIYGSVLGMVFVLLHMGFSLPSGVMGWLLLVLALWTTASGLAGVWLQRHIPVLLAREVSHEALYDRIPELMVTLTQEADALMADASDAFSRTYLSDIRPALSQPAPAWAWLTDLPARRSAALAPLGAARASLPHSEVERANDLESIVRDKTDLDAQLTLQGLLRSWLLLHVPPALLLIALLVVHVAAVVWY
jgi:hypothetical protein